MSIFTALVIKGWGFHVDSLLEEVDSRSNLAVVHAFLHGDGSDLRILADVDRTGIERAVHGRVGLVEGVINGGTVGCAGDGHILRRGVDIFTGRELGSSHRLYSSHVAHVEVGWFLSAGVCRESRGSAIVLECTYAGSADHGTIAVDCDAPHGFFAAVKRHALGCT